MKIIINIFLILIAFGFPEKVFSQNYDNVVTSFVKSYVEAYSSKNINKISAILSKDFINEYNLKVHRKTDYIKSLQNEFSQYKIIKVSYSDLTYYVVNSKKIEIYFTRTKNNDGKLEVSDITFHISRSNTKTGKWLLNKQIKIIREMGKFVDKKESDNEIREEIYGIASGISDIIKFALLITFIIFLLFLIIRFLKLYVFY